MTRTLSLLLILLSIASGAQESLMRPHYAEKTCPDPVKNKIATRKYYQSNCDTADDYWLKHDTVIEFYNRNGRLDSIRRKHPATTPYYEDWHHFYYDKKGRIVCDSTYWYDILEVTTYDYSKNQAIIRTPQAEYTRVHGKVIINYDKNKNRISQYDLDERGDTIYIFLADDSSTHEMYRHRLLDSTMMIYENTVSMHHPSIAWRYTTHISDDHQEWTTSDVQYYFPDGRLKESLTFHNGDLVDSAVCYYDNNLLCAIVTIHSNDLYSFPLYETYKYNERDQLIEYRDGQISYTMRPMITTYSYNERGLLSEVKMRSQYTDGRPDYYFTCVRYEYTYHD